MLRLLNNTSPASVRFTIFYFISTLKASFIERKTYSHKKVLNGSETFPKNDSLRIKSNFLTSNFSFNMCIHAKMLIYEIHIMSTIDFFCLHTKVMLMTF